MEKIPYLAGWDGELVLPFVLSFVSKGEPHVQVVGFVCVGRGIGIVW